MDTILLAVSHCLEFDGFEATPLKTLNVFRFDLGGFANMRTEEIEIRNKGIDRCTITLDRVGSRAESGVLQILLKKRSLSDRVSGKDRASLAADPARAPRFLSSLFGPR